MAHEVILVNLGTPTAPTPEGVRAFLAEFLADPMVVDWPRWLWRPVLSGIVLRRRPARVAKLYESIWTDQGSPLAVATEQLAHGLDAATDARVTHAYRYGEPSLRAALSQALDRADHVTVLPLYAQHTASSSGSVIRLAQSVAASKDASKRLTIATLRPDAPAYVDALAACCKEAFAAFPDGRPEHLLVSFHSIPSRVNRKEGRRYTNDCERTAAALRAALGPVVPEATVTYQSKFGPEPWLGPQTEAVLSSLAAKGVRRVAVTAPGFLTPGLETLEELGVRAREVFLGAGGEQFALVAAPCEHRSLVSALRAASGAKKPAR